MNSCDTEKSTILKPSAKKNSCSPWFLLFIVGIVAFMSALDISVINLAIPQIATAFAITTDTVEMTVSIYLLVICVFILFFGKIGDSFGKIKIFQLGVLFFFLGAIFCGFSTSFDLLLLARAIQALGTSMAFATLYGIINDIFPIAKRGQAIGIIGSLLSLGSVSGPLLGGLILEHFSWNYIFFVNIPTGMSCLFLSLKFLPKEHLNSTEKVDLKGFFFLGIAIVTIFVLFTFTSQIPHIPLLFPLLGMIALLSFLLYLFFERKSTNPLLDLNLFKNKIFTFSLLIALLLSVTRYFSNIVLPLYFEKALQLSSEMTGLILMIFPATMVISSAIIGKFADKFGAAKITIIGALIYGICQLYFAFLNLDFSLEIFAIFMILKGIGYSMLQTPNNLIIMSTAKQSNSGSIGSLKIFTQNIGNFLGISIVTKILYTSISEKAGYPVTTYISNRPDYFIFGQKIVFFTALFVCLLLLLLALYRAKLINSKKNVS